MKTVLTFPGSVELDMSSDRLERHRASSCRVLPQWLHVPIELMMNDVGGLCGSFACMVIDSKSLGR